MPGPLGATTYEEATQCPKCGLPGNVRIKKPAGRNLPPGTQLHTVYCENERCSWYNTCWFVQLNPDGSIPPPSDHRGEPKLYQGFEGHDMEANQIRAALEAAARQETEEGGAEIRNRRL